MVSRSAKGRMRRGVEEGRRQGIQELTPAKAATLVPRLVDTTVTTIQLSLDIVQFIPSLADRGRQS
jgi:hypothetical protein